MISDQFNIPSGPISLRETVKLRPYRAEFHYNLGTVLLTSGDLPGAIAEFQEAIRLNPRVLDYHLKLGLAFSDAKKPSDALVAFRKATEIEPGNADAYGWFGLELRTLGQYAESVEALVQANKLGSKRPGWKHLKVAAEIGRSQRLLKLEKQLPTFLAARETPANVNVWTDLVSIVLSKESYVTATQLLKIAFGADPKLIHAAPPVNRFTAVRCAALCASGLSKKDPPPNEVARTELRRLALGWLEAELAEYTTIVNDGPTEARTRIARVLREWLTLPDLNGIRDDAELTNFPEAERASWRRLWDAVDALRRRASVSGEKQEIPAIELPADPFAK